MKSLRLLSLQELWSSMVSFPGIYFFLKMWSVSHLQQNHQKSIFKCRFLGPALGLLHENLWHKVKNRSVNKHHSAHEAFPLPGELLTSYWSLFYLVSNQSLPLCTLFLFFTIIHNDKQHILFFLFPPFYF